MRFTQLWLQRRVRLLAAQLDQHMPAATLRAYLVAVILLATVPIALLLAYNLASDVRSARQSATALLQQGATMLARTAEQDVSASLDALTALSLSPGLQDGDLRAFDEYLRKLPQRRSQWRSVFVTDDRGRMLLDTVSYSNRPLPVHEETRTLVFKVLARGHAAVSGLSWHMAEGAQVVLLAVPVYQQGVVRYVLGARISADSWGLLLDSAVVPAGGFIALFDADDRPIAIKAAVPLGSPKRQDDTALDPPTQLAAHALIAFQRRSDRSDADRPVVLGTDAVIAGWKRVAGTDWNAGIGLPAEPITAAEQRILWSGLATMGICLLLGVTLASLLAWRLADPLRRMAAGKALPRGRHLPVHEIAQLQHSLQQARQRDHTARKLLQHKAEEFEALFNSSPIGLAFAQDGRGRRILYNPAMQRLMGMETNANASRHTGSVEVFCRGRRLEPGDQPLLRACLHAETVGAMEMEVRVDGRPPTFVVANAVPLLDTRGQARGSISATMDITDLKQAVTLWVDADEGRQERQRLIDLAQEAGHVGFFEYAFKGDRLDCTPGMRLLLCAPEPVPLACLQDWHALVDVADLPKMRNILAAAVEQRAERASFEYRVQRLQGDEDDSVRWLSCRLLLRYGPDGEAERASGTVVDATEQKEVQLRHQRLAAREQDARQEAETANRAKDEFLTMLSHELRNPLGAITAALEVLNSSAGGPATAQRARSIIERQMDHLTHMVGDLLDAGRVVTGKVNMARDCIDLAQVVERVHATLEVTGELNSYAWTFSLAPVQVRGDAMRLEQIVTNLLANAMQYSPAGAPISVEVLSEGREAILRVRDEGCGIAPALLPQVFDLFVQGERPLHRRSGGLGVGLTLVRRLVQQHGGTISVQSEYRRGSVFTVRLPVAVPQRPALALVHSGEAHPGDSIGPDGPSGRFPQAALTSRVSRRTAPLAVALVEDNEDVRQSMQTMLELDGHLVAPAADGLAGLRHILSQRPDAAIVDIGLPGLDGFELARHARAGGYAGRMVAMTGYGQAHSRHDAFKAGFDAYLVKPVNAAQWRAALYPAD